MDRYERIYKKLEPLLHDYMKIENSGYMPLVIEKIGDNEYSIAHYFKENGDLVQDPEMTVKIYPDTKKAEALTFYMPTANIYQEVYPKPGYVVPQYKKDCNYFLEQWLKNIYNQGFIKRLHEMKPASKNAT